MTISLSELLKGLKPFYNDDNQIVFQTIKNMTVVPLTTEDEFSINRFENPMNVIGSNQRYGHLKLRNRSNKDMIVPAQIAVLTKKAAQNHGMVKGAAIKAGQAIDFYDAGCVQGSQTGYIDENDNEIRFIPFGAREYIFEKVNNTGSHTNIYDAITTVGNQTGANSGTYLDQYFTKYQKEINEFIAHFERPEKTIGVIVLVDDEIVAVDKFPSFEYCAQVWDALIRDCYGSIAITEERKNKKSSKVFSSLLKLNEKKSSENTVEYLKRVLLKTQNTLTDKIKNRIEDILDIELQVVNDKISDGYSSNVLKHEGYIGQVISESSYHHLVSLVKKDKFNPERFRAADTMKQLAKKQNKFKL